MKKVKKAIKFDNGKEPMNLLAGVWLKGVSKVLKFGAIKYNSWNWRQGFSYSRLGDALNRHFWSWNEGEDFDPESGLHHLLHLSCCAMFLYVMTQEHPELDDRWKPLKPKKKRKK